MPKRSKTPKKAFGEAVERSLENYGAFHCLNPVRQLADRQAITKLFYKHSMAELRQGFDYVSLSLFSYEIVLKAGYISRFRS